MEQGYIMRTEAINYGISENDLYDYVRNFISQYTNGIIVYGNQDSPLPENSIVITMLYRTSKSLPSTTYNSETKTETSRRSYQVNFQVDIYGGDAGQVYDAIVMLSQNPTSYDYLIENFPNISLINLVERGRMPFINEQQKYENRYMLEMEFSIYNEVSRTIDFIESINVKTIEVK